jgi:DNA-directed RNA polymerase subunit L
MTQKNEILMPHVQHVIDDETLTFTLSRVDLSIANALRRTILSDIPITVFHTETYQDDQCHVSINTGRLHNEIIKQRLLCIPIHEEDLTVLPQKYVMSLDVKNDTDTLLYVTTEHFNVIEKETKQPVSRDQLQKWFPPDKITSHYIEITRLRPAIADTVPGEHIQLTCEFSVGTAKENAAFNVVSTCSYGYTVDAKVAEETWQRKVADDMISKEDLEFERKNFFLLDAQRCAIPNSFDFTIETVGIYTNRKLVRKALAELVKKFTVIKHDLDAHVLKVVPSDSVAEYSLLENSWDVILENEDYTVGKVLEYILHELYYKDKTLAFCGFKKFHPHNTTSHVRIAFAESVPIDMVRNLVSSVCTIAVKVFSKIDEKFIHE